LSEILKKAKEFLKNTQYKRILENVFSLVILNGIDIIFPLITMPYLIYVLGIGGFGIVTFAIVIAQYIALISDYGFLFTATQKISIYRENIKKVSTIFWTATLIRVILGISLFAIFTVIVYFIPKLYEDKMIYLYSFGIVLGNSLIPIWLFQGFEKMKYLTIINVVTKGSFTLLVFVLIKNKTDYEYVTLLSSIGYLLSGIFSMILSVKLFKLKFVIPSYKRIIYELRDGWHIFLSFISMSFYRNSNVLILGIFTNDIAVGYYAAAEKVIKAIQSVINPISNAIFPYFSKKFKNVDEQQNIKTVLNLAKYYVLALLPLSIAITTLSPLLIFVFGSEYTDSIINLQIMGFVVFFGALNYLLGVIGLINMNYKKEFTKFVLISGLISVMVCSIFSPFFYDKAASFSLIVSEGVLFLMLFLFIKSIQKRILS